MTKHSRGMAALMVLMCLLLILPLAGCSVGGASIESSATNYVRLTEYGAGYQLYGTVSGCQLSSEGIVSGQWVLRTANCEATNVYGDP